MKESYVEGLANHKGPELCESDRKDAAEALTVQQLRSTMQPLKNLPLHRGHHGKTRKAIFGASMPRDPSEPHEVKNLAHARKHDLRKLGTRSKSGLKIHCILPACFEPPEGKTSMRRSFYKFSLRQLQQRLKLGS